MESSLRWPLSPPLLRATPHAVLLAGCCGLIVPLAWSPPRAPVVGLLVLAASAWIALVRRERARSAVLALAVVVFVGGMVWGDAQIERTRPVPLDLPAVARGTVVVDASPVPIERGWRVRAHARRLLADGRTVPAGMRIFAELAADAPPVSGRVLEVRGRLRRAAGPESPRWWRRYLDRQGVAARLVVAGSRDLGWRSGAAGLRERWRARLRSSVGAPLAGDRRALVRGMALGGGSELTERTAEAFRRSGLWHLLAVSGQNVTVVALAALMLLRTARVARPAAVIGASLALAAYCLAADGGASVGRACAVGALGLVAELRPGPRERWYVLLVGLAALLAAQPRSVHDPGLQLSFAAVAGLTAAGPRVEGALHGWLPGPLNRLAAAAVAAGVATAPVLAWHFETVSLAGLLANIVAVPLAGPVVVVALLGGLVALPAPVVAGPMAWLAGLGADAMLAVAHVASLPPGASVTVPRWSAPLMLLTGLAWWVASGVDGGRWTPIRLLRRWPRQGVAVAALGVATLLVAGRPGSPPPWPDAPEIAVLDVGQGQAILLRDASGAAILVDSGPPGTPAPVVAALERLGVERLDALALTHPALDHVGGTVAMLDSVRVDRLLVPPTPRGEPHPPTGEALAAAAERDVGVVEIRAGDVVRSGGWRLDVLWPRRRPAAGADPNLGSLVLRASSASLRALLPADAESPTLGPLPIGPVDAIVVGHHGSADPGLGALLTGLRPAVGAISVGAGNRFGHPHAETLARLRAEGVRTLRTDRHGDLILRRDATGVVVAPSR